MNPKDSSTSIGGNKFALSGVLRRSQGENPPSPVQTVRRRQLHFLVEMAAVAGFLIPAAVWAQGPQLAPEGHGLLPRPAQTPGELGGVPPAHVFMPDPSGGFVRTIFETDDDPDFKIMIREYSFPPDRQKHSIVLASGALARLLSGVGDIIVADKHLDLASVARAALPAGASIEVTNSGEYPVVVRALILEAK